MILGGQHTPFWGGQYAPFLGGQLKPFWGGQHERYFHPRPRTPYQFKLWHAAVIGVVGYFAYKGIMYSIQEKSIRMKRKQD